MSTRERIKGYAESAGIEELLLLDPATFDDAIMGLAYRAGGMCVVAYDYMGCIRILMRDGMDREEAEEFLEFNTLNAWVGEATPVFIDTRIAE